MDANRLVQLLKNTGTAGVKLLERLGLKGTPLFGEEVAQQARTKGLSVGMHSIDWMSPEQRAALQKTVKRVSDVNLFAPTMKGNGPAYTIPKSNVGGVVIAPIGVPGVEVPAGSRVIGGVLPYGGFGSKSEEAKHFKGFAPTTINMHELLSKHNLDYRTLSAQYGNIAPEQLYNHPAIRGRVLKAIRAEVGPTHIIKPESGGASHGGMETELTRKLPQGMGLPSANKEWVVQQRIPMQPTSAVERVIDQFYNIRNMPRGRDNPEGGIVSDIIRAIKERDQVGKVRGASSLTSKGTREYRVSAIGGKVIPGGTVGRGSMLDWGNPFYTKTHREVEALAQQMLDKLPDKVRNVGYGFDIGISQAGKPFLIESNPSALLEKGNLIEAGASGYFAHPYFPGTVASAVKGQLPLRRHLQNALVFGAPPLVAGGTAYKAMQPEQESKSKYTGLSNIVGEF